MGVAPDSRLDRRPQSWFEASRIEEGIVSYDALMRWEWEGGAPATVSERERAEHNEPGKTPPTRPPVAGRLSARTSSPEGRAATVGTPRER